MVYDSIALGVVVATYPEAASVDVLLIDEGRRLRGVQVAVSTGSSSTGTLDLPDVGGPADETRWDLTIDRDRYIRALVAFVRGVPVVIGFLLPQVNQITFKEPNRRIMRHASDVYTSIDDEGNIEICHPSGTYLRVGTEPEHEDLTGADFDQKWSIARNTDKAVHVQLTVKNAGAEKASLNIDPDGNVTLKHVGNLSTETGGNASIQVDGNATVQVDGNTSVNTNGNAEVSAGGTMDVHSDGAMNISSGTSIKLEAPRIDLN